MTDGNVELNVGAFPSGTQLLFYQASAPSGWTKVTGVGNRVVKIVEDTSGGTTGGTNNFSDTFKSLSTNSVSTSGTVGGTSLSVAQLAKHTHTTLGSSSSSGYDAANYFEHSSLSSTSTGSTGSNQSHSHSFTGSSHSHTVNLSVKYINVIVCRKD